MAIKFFTTFIFFLRDTKIWNLWAEPVDLSELDEKVKSLMEKSPNRDSRGQFAYVCKICGREGQGPRIKDHIEANHLEGVVIPCNFCETTFRTRNALRLHKTRTHP